VPEQSEALAAASPPTRSTAPAEPAATAATPDLAAPERWLESRRRSRGRRLAVARTRRRRRLSRRGTLAVVTAMTVAAGAAMAQEATRAPGSGPARAALTMGATGPSVAALQRAIGVTADGAFGPITRRALKRWQRAHGLAADGVAGPATLAALGIRGRRVTVTRTTAPNDTLARIAECESGGDPTAISATGRYRGKYQFSRATWRALGGKGDPAAAPEAEQDQRAATLLARDGTTPWPVCGRRA